MYVDHQHHQLINPLVVSHGFQSGFNSKFIGYLMNNVTGGK